mgnify:CR=1 FL=1
MVEELSLAAEATGGCRLCGLQSAIRQHALAKGSLEVLPLEAEQEIAERLGVSRWEVEVAALRMRVLPSRYERSLGTVGWEGQLKLLRSTVAVIGAGGLGGYVVEGLARMGVGRLIVVDGDVFEEHNLNRQLFCTEADLGRSKAQVAAERVRAINGAVTVDARHELADADNLPSILEEAEVVVDALDSLPARLLLQQAAAKRGIPMVHGAIAGYMAQVMTIFPGDPGLTQVYGTADLPQKGVEVSLGNPAGTPMLCAALQVEETIKVLLGEGEPLRNRLLMVDAEMGEVQVLRWA